MNRAAKRRQSAKRRQKYGSGSDRISQLPESVLHHILCFLSPKKAVQTSVLSKPWRHLGPTRPIIDLRGACDDFHARRTDFCENCFCGNSEALLSVVDNTFQRYHDQNLSTQELRLDMCCIDSQSITVLEKWIPMFIKPNSCVTTFRLSFNIYKYVGLNDLPRLDLPSSVFKAESLQDLYLSLFCRISSIENVVLTNLQKLSLIWVDIDNETLEKIISGCPFLQYVYLRYCKGLKTISIKKENQHLRDFKFIACTNEKKIELDVMEIDGPSLQNIHIEGHLNLNWKLNRNYYFPHLKSLYLTLVQLSTKSFENFSHNFPLLEEFTLNGCHGFDEINLFCPSLKHLTIVQMNRSIKVNVDAPNILCFMCSGRFLPTTISFAKASIEWKSKITWGVGEFGYDHVLPRFLQLNEMLKGVSQSKISLHILGSSYCKGMQIECGVHDTVVVENLDIVSNFDSVPCLFYPLFQICRPRYVTIAYDSQSSRYNNGSHGKQTIAEYIREIFIHEKEKNKYYWQENLMEVSIEAYDFIGKVWHHVERTCSLPESSKNQKIRFQLKWRD